MVTRLKMAILRCPLDYARDELNPQTEGTSVRNFVFKFDVAISASNSDL